MAVMLSEQLSALFLWRREFFITPGGAQSLFPAPAQETMWYWGIKRSFSHTQAMHSAHGASSASLESGARVHSHPVLRSKALRPEYDLHMP